MRTVAFVLCIVFVSLCVVPMCAAASVNLDGRVAIANLDRYPATLRLGKTLKEVPARKASVLRPKKFPVILEYWSGNTKLGWKKISLSESGAYGMNFKSGQWAVTRLKTGSGKSSAQRPKPTTRTVRPATRTVHPKFRHRSTVIRDRWHPLARAAYAAARIYSFVRDEQDRDMLRYLLLEGRDKDLVDFDRWLKAVNLPADEKDQLREALDDLSGLKEEDWKAIEDATDEDWDNAKVGLGDLVDKDSWNEIETDLADVDDEGFWQEEDGEVDLGDTMELDGDYDLGDGFAEADTMDLDDLDIDEGNYDLGDFDDYDYDGGDYGGDDFYDDDVGNYEDYGGGYGDFGDDFGGFDDGGFDGFDDGGFDDF